MYDHFQIYDVYVCTLLFNKHNFEGLEEGTEHFHHLDKLLLNVCLKVGEMEYYGSLWRCVLASTNVRLTALQLVYRRFDSKKLVDDQLYIIGTNVDVMVIKLSLLLPII